MLDTNICIFAIKRKSHLIASRIRKHQSSVVLSSVVLAELRFGADKSQQPSKNHFALDLFLQPLQVSGLMADVATVYGRVRTTLESLGTPIGPLDTLIAAHALSMNATLVTNNTREFSRVPCLQLEDWSQ